MIIAEIKLNTEAEKWHLFRKLYKLGFSWHSGDSILSDIVKPFNSFRPVFVHIHDDKTLTYSGRPLTNW